MNEVIVIFCLAATGCLAYLSTDLALQAVARKTQRRTIISGPSHDQSPAAHSKPDPLVALGLTLGGYGAIALGIVSALPGELAIQRTWLAFAFMCVGGLIAEISRTGTNAEEPEVDSDEAEFIEATQRTPGSAGLSMALMLVLNATLAVLSSGQGLVQVVPPATSISGTQSAQLDPIVVVARRASDPLS